MYQDCQQKKNTRNHCDTELMACLSKCFKFYCQVLACALETPWALFLVLQLKCGLGYLVEYIEFDTSTVSFDVSVVVICEWTELIYSFMLYY